MFEIERGGRKITLGKAHLAVLLALYHSRELNFSKIKKVTGGNSGYVNSILYDLKDLKLINERREKNRRIFSLTDAGMEIAKALDEVARRLRR